MSIPIKEKKFNLIVNEKTMLECAELNKIDTYIITLKAEDEFYLESCGNYDSMNKYSFMEYRVWLRHFTFLNVVLAENKDLFISESYGCYACIVESKSNSLFHIRVDFSKLTHYTMYSDGIESKCKKDKTVLQVRKSIESLAERTMPEFIKKSELMNESLVRFNKRKEVINKLREDHSEVFFQSSVMNDLDGIIYGAFGFRELHLNCDGSGASRLTLDGISIEKLNKILTVLKD